MAPKALMASIRKLRSWRAVTSASFSIGFRMPEVVSQWTPATWVIWGSAARAWPSASGSQGVSSGVSRTVLAVPMASQIRAMRLP
jgi:hypothetical protein